LVTIARQPLTVHPLDFDDDDDENDIGCEHDGMKPFRRPYEIDFQCLGPDDIESSQQKQVDELCQILGLPPESIAILLRHMRWNKEKLLEVYMDRPEEVLEEAGLGPNASRAPKTEVINGFTCEICYEDGLDLQTYAMVCGHRYCVDCYSHYLWQKVQEEGEAARIRCPRDGCHHIVDSKSLKLLVDDKIKDRLVVLLLCLIGSYRSTHKFADTKFF
jgi:ariadne-1